MINQMSKSSSACQKMRTDEANAVTSDQSLIIKFLENPATHNGAYVERVDTHLSHVFLTRTDVYKLKRSANLGFVDYSSLELRKHFCEEELSANQTWASSLYLGVLPIRLCNGHYNLGGSSGEIADWLVHMRRFPNENRLDRRIKAGKAGAKEFTRFSDDLYAQHSQATAEARFGGSEAVARLIAQLTNDLGNTTFGIGKGSAIYAWRSQLQQRYARVSGLLEQRRTDGKVKRCHGDLHLKNICMWGGKLIGFDALEFADEMSTIDVLYDLAFPIMDLVHAGFGNAANLALNRYFGRSGDYEGLQVFALFLSLRAGVRALASAITGDDVSARAYFRTATSLLAPRTKPRLIAIGGRSGSGKSTIAAAIAPEIARAPGAIILSSDLLRKVQLGLSPEERLNASVYREGHRAQVYRHMYDCARLVLKAGYDCILDATFLSQDEQKAVLDLAHDTDTACHRIWLHSPAMYLHARIAERGPNASDADHTVLDKQLRQPAPTNWVRVDASKTAISTAQSVIDEIKIRSLTETPD